MKKILFFFCVALFAFSAGAFAQPRPAEKPTPKPVPAKAAPASFTAKYEGGMFGYSKKEEGTLKFDDDNNRFVFFGKDQKEKFAIPYQAMLVIFPQSQSVQSNAGKVVSVIPYAGLLGGFIKEKRRYLIINYSDPDIEQAKGMVNFRLENMELLDSVLVSLAKKADLKQRGDAYYRPKEVKFEEDK